MAQWKLPNYDIWPEALGTALRLLRCAADAWVSQTESAPTVEQVLALLIRSLVRPWEAGEMPLALGRCIDRVGTPADECAGSTRKFSPEQVDIVLAELAETLTAAARQWATDGPENPLTERVLHALAHTMFRHGLVTTPPPPRIDG